MGVSTAALLVGALTPSKGDQEVAQHPGPLRTLDRRPRRAALQRGRPAEHQRRLVPGPGQHGREAPCSARHAAHRPEGRARRRPGAGAGAAGPGRRPQDSPAQRIQSVEQDQDRLIDAAETFAKNRADRLKLAFRLAGLDPAAYAGASDGLGGPLIEGKDPRALAAVLDVDEDFAGRLQHAAADLSDMQALAVVRSGDPAGQADRPARARPAASAFAPIPSPATPAFHPGQDFAGAYGSPIYVTAPGIVSFTGVRNGYGNTVEVDHGHGFKTRYGHLSAISVASASTWPSASGSAPWAPPDVPPARTCTTRCG